MSYAPILTIANEKGGVGKTATAVNVAAALARAGLRVVAVDGDSQADLTWGVGAEPDQGPGFAEAIEHAAQGETFGPAMLLPTVVDGLRVLAGGQGLAEVAPELYTAGADGEEWVSTALRAVAELEDVDVVVIDTPPSPGPVTIGAIMAADLTLAIANARQANSVAALQTLIERAKAISARGGHGGVRVVLQGHDEHRVLHRDMRDRLQAEPEGLFAVIPHSKDVEESPLDGVPLVASRGRGSSRTAWALCDLAQDAYNVARQIHAQQVTAA